MTQPYTPSAVPPELSRMAVLDTEIAYIDRGQGDPIVLLHGNPTSSYLWRNVIPHLEGLGRCLAADLVGMGGSGKAKDGSYRFVDHSRYLDQWFESLGLDQNVTLVVHDWGSALGFHWAHRHPPSVKALVYLEAIVRPLAWEEWPDSATPIFQGMRSPDGEVMVLERNLFVERVFARKHHSGVKPRGNGHLPPSLLGTRGIQEAHTHMAQGNPHRRPSRRRSGNRVGIFPVAVHEQPAEIVHQRGPWGDSDGRTTGFLPRLAQSTRGYCPRQALPPRRLPRGDREGHRGMV